MLCLPFHSTARGPLGHSHRVAKVVSNAGDLSLVVVLGIRKDMVVLAFADSTLMEKHDDPCMAFI